MGMADFIYDKIVVDILANGIWDKDQQVRTKWKDGTPAHTKSIISTQMKFDNTEVPILTKKKVNWQAAIKEILWIWQMKSNRVQDLRDMGVNIWNEWELEDGTIGKAYGYQLSQLCRSINPKNNLPIITMLDQVDYLLWELHNKPASRRIITTLWDKDDLDEMALTPCVWNTQWLVKENKLHLIVGIRSNDMFLGNPFNIFQYYVLQRMITQVTGYELGTLTYNINDAHLYERHIDLAKYQLSQFAYPAPYLEINPDIKNFYDFRIDDFKLEGYKHGPYIKAEIAI